MFKNRYYNNSKKQITSLFKFSTYNKSSSSSENNNRDKLKKRLTQIRNRILNKEYKHQNIKIINCFDVNELQYNVKNIAEKYEKILNTAGEKIYK